MKATEYEVKAIEAFKSTDKTRMSMNRVWRYASDGGETLVATNGHVIVLRHWGTHCAMARADIRKLGPSNLTVADELERNEPPAWDMVSKPPHVNGKSPEVRGIDPAYFALVAGIEKAELKRRRETAQQKPGESHKNYRKRLGSMLACSEWILGSDPLDGWYFRIPDPGDGVLWEGVIMPRRV